MRRTLHALIGLAALLGASATLGPAPALGHERLLRCVTSPVSASAGHHRQRFAQRRFYAPVHSAMFFARAGSACRWKAAHRRRG